MDVGRRRRSTSSGSGVVAAGSVWESRMRHDEVKGGIKVFNGTDDTSQENTDEKSNHDNDGAIITAVTTSTGTQGDRRMSLRPRQSLVAVSGKRKTWKSESIEGNPIQIARQRSEMGKNLEEQAKELSVSADGIKRSPARIKKTRSDASTTNKELMIVAAGADGTEKSSPVQRTSKSRSVWQKGSSESSTDANENNAVVLRKVNSVPNKTLLVDDGNESDPALRKVKSESTKALDFSSDGGAMNSLQLVTVPPPVSSKTFGEEKKVADQPTKNLQGSIKNVPLGIKKTKSEENCREFGVCEEKVIQSDSIKAVQVKGPPKLEESDDNSDGLEEDWEELEEDASEEIDVEVEKKSLVIKEINISEEKPKKTVIQEKKFHQRNERPVSIPSIVKKQTPPAVNLNHASVHSSPSKARPIPVGDEYQSIPRTHNKLQSLVDLVMWRDVSKSALVFGVGAFVIISSSYTKDLNISLISVLSYMGLFYLAAIFLFRSFICRGAIDSESSRLSYVLGEEEAIWLLKLVLPYINECLLKLRALFSGDPATTMKMAVLLFILARCGSSITIWKMAKLGFFGVFTVPKVCTSYSTQLTAYGKFWVRRFRDAWESCSHKKAVAFAIFTVVWNLSSVVARIWAAFMLFVAFKYYQHNLMKEEWIQEEETNRAEDSWQQEVGRQRQSRRSTLMETRKQKKPL